MSEDVLLSNPTTSAVQKVEPNDTLKLMKGYDDFELGSPEKVEQMIKEQLNGKQYVQLTENATVFNIPGMNPTKFMLCGTNCFAIGVGKRRFLIDACQKDVPRFLDNL